MIDTVDKFLYLLEMKQGKYTYAGMGEKQDIEISQRITLHVSLPTAKLKLLGERHILSGIPRKMPKAIVDFEGMVLFFLS